jgi:hypothetical protein
VQACFEKHRQYITIICYSAPKKPSYARFEVCALRQLDGENIIYLYCSVAARRYWRFNPPQ